MHNHYYTSVVILADSKESYDRKRGKNFPWLPIPEAEDITRVSVEVTNSKTICWTKPLSRRKTKP